MDFAAFIQTAEKNKWNLYGIEIFENNNIIHKYSKEPEKRYPIYSATKTITSTAVGIAVSEGKFSIDASIYDYLHNEIPTELSDKQKKDLKTITIKRLLTMSVQGYPFRPQGENWLEFSLSCPLENVETPVFAYSNIPAYLVGAALEKAVGQHLISWLEPRLFEPLDIKMPVYQNCPSNHFYGASGMELTVHELSKIGQLYLQNGIYQHQKILPFEWVQQATDIQQINREGGYGYFIWKYRNGCRISGKWGQRCYIFPDRGLMITYLSHMEHGSEDITQAVEQYLL